MDLKSYTKTEKGNATRLADALGISLSYLSQMSKGTASVSPERAVEIEAATGGAVTRRDLFPSNWQKIWPELQASEAA